MDCANVVSASTICRFVVQIHIEIGLLNREGSIFTTVLDVWGGRGEGQSVRLDSGLEAQAILNHTHTHTHKAADIVLGLLYINANTKTNTHTRMHAFVYTHTHARTHTHFGESIVTLWCWTELKWTT